MFALRRLFVVPAACETAAGETEIQNGSKHGSEAPPSQGGQQGAARLPPVEGAVLRVKVCVSFKAPGAAPRSKL